MGSNICENGKTWVSRGLLQWGQGLDQGGKKKRSLGNTQPEYEFTPFREDTPTDKKEGIPRVETKGTSRAALLLERKNTEPNGPEQTSGRHENPIFEKTLVGGGVKITRGKMSATAGGKKGNPSKEPFSKGSALETAGQDKPLTKMN